MLGGSGFPSQGLASVGKGILEDAVAYPSSSMICRTLQEPRELAADSDMDDFVEVEMSGYRLCASGILASRS